MATTEYRAEVPGTSYSAQRVAAHPLYLLLDTKGPHPGGPPELAGDWSARAHRAGALHELGALHGLRPARAHNRSQALHPHRQLTPSVPDGHPARAGSTAGAHFVQEQGATCKRWALGPYITLPVL